MLSSAVRRIVCVCHDVERGLGHLDSDPVFAEAAARESPGHLDDMLAVEREIGVRATYHILGCLFGAIGDRVRAEGHCLGFHSYDHLVDEPQLARCRTVDAGVRGYRPPRSQLTPELSEENLARHGFAWLASSAPSLGSAIPHLSRGIAKIPILFDDYALYQRREAYATWRNRAFALIARTSFVCFSLHDCYAADWLPQYRQLLGELGRLGQFWTLDEVSQALRAEGGHAAGGRIRGDGGPRWCIGIRRPS